MHLFFVLKKFTNNFMKNIVIHVKKWYNNMIENFER